MAVFCGLLVKELNSYSFFQAAFYSSPSNVSLNFTLHAI